MNCSDKLLVGHARRELPRPRVRLTTEAADALCDVAIQTRGGYDLRVLCDPSA